MNEVNENKKKVMKKIKKNSYNVRKIAFQIELRKIDCVLVNLIRMKKPKLSMNVSRAQ
jgi:hypothetical protein